MHENKINKKLYSKEDYNNKSIIIFINNNIKRASFTKIKKNKKNVLLSNKSLLTFLFLFFIILLFFYLVFLKIFKSRKYRNNIQDIIKNNNGKEIISKNEIILNENELKKKSYLEQLNYFENRMKELRRSSIIWPLPSEIALKPLMIPIDIREFCYFMKPENIYFEFGAGGSTNIASYYKLNKIYSVESDRLWHEKIKNNNIKGITFLTVDLKVIKDGYPGPGTTIEDWKRYIQSYKSEYNADIVLIDGRFRVACALDIFSKIRYNTLVLIHDYERVEYHILENFYIKIKKWGALAAFFKNPNITSIPNEIYNKYLNVSY